MRSSRSESGGRVRPRPHVWRRTGCAPRASPARAIALFAAAIAAGCGKDRVTAADAGPTPDTGTSASCDPPRQVCGAACANLSTDPFNCGHCATVCQQGTFCSGGNCLHACPNGQRACGASCVDVTTDHDNCGGCNMPCSADRQCKGGACHCPEFTSDCHGNCLNTDQDQANCGLCDRQCRPDQICNRGSCVCAMGTRESNCNDGIDNNCNGLIDCADPDCMNATRACQGRCGPGIEMCGPNGQWTPCMGGDGSPEVCGSGIDSDCDGKTLRNPSPYEPNDDCDHAWPVPGTNPNVELMPRFDSVEDTEDYFRFDAVDSFFLYPQHIRLTADQIPAGHSYGLYLYANLADCKSGTSLAESLNPGDSAQMVDWVEHFFGDDSGTYYVRVVSLMGHSCTSNYHLVINGLNP